MLTLPRLSALASAGVARSTSTAARALDLFVTGSELLPPGAPPEPGKIYESNGLTVSLLAEAAGAEVVQHPSVADDVEATRAAVERGLEGDILVVSGGVSVGPHDHVKPAFEACGVEEVFWRVRIKPGKPLWFGRRGSTLVFGLPGQPAVGDRRHGAVRRPRAAPPARRDRRRPALRARPPRRARRARRRPHHVPDLQARPRADGVLVAFPTERQGSHMTGALGESDGFAVAPHGSGPLPAGAEVDLLRV